MQWASTTTRGQFKSAALPGRSAVGRTIAADFKASLLARRLAPGNGPGKEEKRGGGCGTPSPPGPFQGRPAEPREAQEGPGKPREAQGGPGGPKEGSEDPTTRIEFQKGV